MVVDRGGAVPKGLCAPSHSQLTNLRVFDRVEIPFGEAAIPLTMNGVWHAADAF